MFKRKSLLLSGILIATLAGAGCAKKEPTQLSASIELGSGQEANPLGGDPSVCGFANLMANKFDDAGSPRLEYSCKTSVGEAWNFGFFVDQSGYRFLGSAKQYFVYAYDSKNCEIVATKSSNEFFRATNPVLVNGQLVSMRVSVRDYSGSTSPYIIYDLSECKLYSVLR